MVYYAQQMYNIRPLATYFDVLLFEWPTNTTCNGKSHLDIIVPGRLRQWTVCILCHVSIAVFVDRTRQTLVPWLRYWGTSHAHCPFHLVALKLGAGDIRHWGVSSVAWGQ